MIELTIPAEQAEGLLELIVRETEMYCTGVGTPERIVSLRVLQEELSEKLGA